MSFDGTVIKRTTITRPANTTAYAANDAIGDVGGSAIIQLVNVGSPGKDIYLSGISVKIDSATLPTSNGALTARFYNAAPTAIADNASWDLVAGDRAAFQATIAIGTPVDLGSTLFIKSVLATEHPITMVTADLWLIVTTDAAITFAENSTVIAVDTYWVRK